MIKLDALGKLILPSILVCSTVTLMADPPQGTTWTPTLVWSDEFDGTALDTTKWQAVDGVARQGASTWEADEVSVSGGYLNLGITATKIPTNSSDMANYNCGAVRTLKDYSIPLFTQTYGYFEARCKLPARIDADYWAAFWMMAGTVSDTQPSTQLGNEIDIMESFNIADNGKHYLTMHWNGYGTLHNSYSLNCGTPASLRDGGFHVYGFYWDQNIYISYVDGVEVGRTSFIGLGSSTGGKTPSDGTCRQPGYIKLTCEAAQWPGGSGWESPFPTNDVFIVDYVRVYTCVDTNPPTISTLNPADNATGVAVGANLVAIFSEAIAKGTGDITVKNLTDGTQTVIAVTNTAQVTVSGSTLTINPTADLLSGKNYALQIAATAIDDLAGNSFAGILNDATWNFTIASVGSGTWTYNGADATSNTWTTAGSWSGGTIADGANFTASFIVDITAPRTITLGGNRTIGNITFTDTDSSHNLTLTGNTLTLDVTSGAPLINVTQADRTLTISSILAGNDGLTKTGLGTLASAGVNTYTGNTTVSGGTLKIAGAGRIYSAAYNGSAVVTVQTGTVLELDTWSYGTGESLGQLAKEAARISINGGAIRMNGTTTYGRGVTVLAGGATFEAAAGANWTQGGPYDFTANVYTGNPSLTFTGAGTGRFEKVFSGSGSLIKYGVGTWTLTTNNTYTGLTDVQAGTLLVNGNQSGATGNVTVSADAALGGTGVMGGNTTITAGGKLEFNISTPAASHDQLELAAGKSLTFSDASVLTITSTGGAAVGTYTLLTAPGGITGNAPATVNLPPGWVGTVSKSGNSLVLNLTALTGATYSVTYDSNGSTGGSVPTDANAYTNGAIVTVSGNTGSLTRTGYAFTGWNTATNGSGASFAPAATFAISGNSTLYAKWTALSALPYEPYQSWLIAYYGITNVNDSAISSNGVNTILEAYIAGLDPKSTSNVFAVTGVGAPSGSAVINWDSVSGRLYNVFWSSNLLNGGGFQLLYSNLPWNVNTVTDTVHAARNEGYYRIDVKFE